LPENGVAAEHAHTADRFAREIGGILTLSGAARSRRLNATPLGRAPSSLYFTKARLFGTLHCTITREPK
jgi:hypothetical protein